MKKLSLLGEELVEYKREFMKGHSPLVIQSLKLGIEQMMKANAISQEVYFSLVDDDMTVEKFKLFLVNKKEFQKSEKEMLEDYDMIANDMISSLKKYEIFDVLKESEPDKERIKFIQTFTLDKDFARNHFLIENEQDLEKLFARRGFFEKFSVLRLKKIFSDWTLIEGVKENLLSVHITDVYYDADKKVYNIDIEYRVPFELCENKSLADDVVIEITRLYESSNHHFETML